MSRSNVAIALAVAGLMVLAACGSSGVDGVGGDGQAGSVVVVDPWVRPTPPISNVGAIYMRVRNEGDESDAVVGVSAARCDVMEIHQTTVVNGVASMSEATAADLVLGPGQSLVFQPAGLLHVMCLGLDEPVVDGELVTLTVELEQAGPLTVQAVAENR